VYKKIASPRVVYPLAIPDC